MKLSQSILVVLASFLGAAVADTHRDCWCGVNYSAGAGGGWRLYEGSTKAACAKYKARNTGSHIYDTCPDCAMTGSYSGITIVGCHSDGGHLGGDEWDYYCGQVANQQGFCKN